LGASTMGCCCCGGIELENVPILTTECGICLEPLKSEPTRSASPLCSHSYHVACMKEHIKTKLESLQIPVLCPDPNCGAAVFSQRDLNRLDPELREAYLYALFHRYIQSTPGISYCPTPDCPFVFEWERGKCNEFSCPICDHSYCLECLQPAHDGSSCESMRSREQRDFEGFVQGQGWRQCKLCGVWVERADGCDNVTCRCGYQFCYICGAPPRGCKCSPGHGFYSVNAVRGNFAVTQVCYCNRVGGVCVCE